MNATGSSTTIVTEITINAAAAKIFAALTDPDQLTQWWGEPGLYRTTHMERDLHVGGNWRTTGVGANGEQFSVEGVYRTVEPPALLEYTWNYTWGESHRETLVRFDLTEHDGATDVRVTHSGFLDPQMRDDHKKGWSRVLGWLSSYVQ